MKIKTNKNEQLGYDDLKEVKVYLQKNKESGNFYMSKIINIKLSELTFNDVDIVYFEGKSVTRIADMDYLEDYFFYKPTKKQLSFYNKCVEAGKFIEPEKKNKASNEKVFAKYNYLSEKIKSLESIARSQDNEIKALKKEFGRLILSYKIDKIVPF